MTRTSLRSRLLTTTAVLSVVLASMTPARLPAQETAPAEVPPVAAPTQATPPEAEAPAPAPEEAAPETPQAVTPDMEVMEPEPAPAHKPAPAEAETPKAPAATTEEAPAPRTPKAAEPEAPAATPDEAPAPRTPKAAEPEEETAPRATEAPEGRDTNAAGSKESAPARRDAAEPEADEPEATPAERNSLKPETDATETEAPPARPAEESDAPAAGEEAPAAREEAPATRDTKATRAAEPAKGDDAEAVDTLNSLLGDKDGAAPAAAAAAAAAASGDDPLDNATVTEVTEENARSSDEDFRTSASGEERESDKKKNKDKDDDDDDGLSNLQKVGLLALGGLAVGALMNNGDEVVSNTGDRVVLRQNDGSYQVLKDDDALLRQPGSTVRTENYADGSTRSIVEQGDGSRIETIRDASGRVLRRARINPNGTQTLLIDDTRQAAPVDLSRLPQAREDVRVSATDRTSLRDALDRIEARDDARLYSLSQIRDYRQVRALAPVVDVDNITFRTGSAAVEASEAEQLSDLGNLMREMIDERPGEVFLIEGHTDAVGSAASNLALSDRRAESVALALTEYFDVPPENMVVQGYGESDLRVKAEGDEARNRRVAVRIITPILQVAQNQ